MILVDTQKVQKFFEDAKNNIKVSEERVNLLNEIAAKIYSAKKSNLKNTSLNFICTHNSRRSQLAQVWGYFSAHYFQLPINSFSGGTAVTAFYKNTLKTLRSAGFNFNILHFNHQNPTYAISFSPDVRPLLGFSKLYDHSINKEPYFAITTCSSADENCPFIPNALGRFHLPFTDPKTYDNCKNTDEEYLKTNQQIAAEIFILFSELKKLSENV